MANAHGSATSWEQPAWIPHPAGAAEPGLGPVEDTGAPGQERLTRPTGRYSSSIPIGGVTGDARADRVSRR